MSDENLIQRFTAETRDVLERLDRSRVEAVVDVLFEAWQQQQTVYVFGNGGSASTAQHLAADLFKCTLVPGKPRFRVLCLNDNMPLISALTNDDGWDQVYEAQLRTWWRPGDVAFGVSVHGGVGSDQAGPWSQNVVRGLRYAVEHGGAAVGMAGFDGGVMAEMCDACIVVPAESTPQVEGMHVVLHHLISTAVRERIERS